MTASPPRLALLLLVYAAFVGIGLPDGILGAAWPEMRAELSVALDDNWPLLALGTCGSALSNFSSGLALRRLGVGKVLLLTTFLTAAVVFGYSLAGTFAVISGLAFFLGLGNGAIDAGLNQFAAEKLSSRHMSWLHASWGVGVSIGTSLLSLSVALGGTWRGAYRWIALLLLALGVAFVANRRALPSSTPEARTEGGPSRPTFAATLRLPAARLSMAAFFVYCGLESGAGLWIASMLHDGRGWTAQAAGMMSTLYWASLTVGRFLIGVVAQRASTARIVTGAAVGAVMGTGLVAWSSTLSGTGTGSETWAGVVTASGLLLTGLSLAPIFPLLMHDTPRRVGAPHSVNLIGFQGGVAQLGMTLVPIALGAVLQAFSIEWLGALLTALALLLLALVWVGNRHVAEPAR